MSSTAQVDFLTDGGDMGARTRAFDWAHHPLGDPAGWPQALRTAVRLVLSTQHPMLIFWGREMYCLYNDSFAQSLGPEKHPAMLGAKGREMWAEVWPVVGDSLEMVLAGRGSVYSENQKVPIVRHGKLEDVYWTYSYNPIDDEMSPGGVGGVLVVCTETTQAVLAEQRKAEEAARQQRLFQQAPGFIIIMRGPDHVVEFVNDAHKDVFGSAGWEGLPIREAFPSLDGQGFFERLDEVYRTGETYEANGVPVRYQRAAGTAPENRALTFIYAPLHDEDGAIDGIFCEGFDVTHQRYSQLRHVALAQLADIVRELDDPEAIAYAAAEILGRGLDISRAGYGTIDRPTETIRIERDWNAPGIASIAGLLHFRDYGSYIDDLKAGRTVVVSNADLDPRTRETASSLKAISAHSFVNMPVTEQGDAVALLFLNHEGPREWLSEELDLIREFADRTRTAVERRRAELALRANERRLAFLDELGKATAAAASADAILAITTRMVAEHLGLSNCAYADMDEDQDGFTIRGDWAAPGSPSIVGHYSLADFGTLAVRELGAGRPLIVNDNLAELLPEEAKSFQDIGIAATICMPLVKQGRLTALMAIHDKTPRQWTDYDLAMIREVTERSWAHIERVRASAQLRESALALAELNRTLEHRVAERSEQLLRTEEALRQSQKMEAVGQLTGGLAHDFNNLLTGIGGSLELIKARVAQGRVAELDRYLEAGQGAVKRAAALTHRLLAFSRRQTLNPKPVDMNRMVAGIEELIRRTVGPAVEVEVDPGNGVWTVLADPNQLENALLNLCINARDAMPDGGCLTIETGNRTLDAREAGQLDLAAGEYATLAVTDTGVGMPADVKAKAFDPFFTTKPLGQGTGLGLSMIYGFVRQSGGQVRIDSEPERGTTVCIFLPHHAAEVASDEQSPGPKAPGLSADGETVLVIDDEPTIRMLIADVLEEAGFATLEAGDGPAGLKILESSARIDLLITDVGLPGGLNGRQVADAARSLRPGLKILFITGYAEEAVVREGKLESGMSLITKPFHVETLASKIRDTLAT